MPTRASSHQVTGYDPAALQYNVFGMFVAFNVDATILSYPRHHLQSIIFSLFAVVVATQWGSSPEWKVATLIVEMMNMAISRLTAFVIGGFVSLQGVNE